MTRTELIALARAAMTPEYLASVMLRSGIGTGEVGDACLIQEERRMLRDAALAAGDAALAADYDPKTDACPVCTSPLCRDLGIQVQDAREDWRRECIALLPLLLGSRGSDELEKRRLYRLLDWAVREALPAILDVLAASLASHDAALADRLRGHASTLRALAAIKDETSREAASKCDLDLALARALARARDLDLDLALALDLDLPSPVALLRELLEMEEADCSLTSAK